VKLEADLANGRLINFIESHAQIQDRQFADGRITLIAVIGKRTLADLSRNDQVVIKYVNSGQE